MMFIPDALSFIFDATMNNVVRLVTGYVLDRQSGNMAGISGIRASQQTVAEMHTTKYAKTLHTMDDAPSDAGGDEDEGRAASSSLAPPCNFVSSGKKLWVAASSPLE